MPAHKKPVAAGEEVSGFVCLAGVDGRSVSTRWACRACGTERAGSHRDIVGHRRRKGNGCRGCPRAERIYSKKYEAAGHREIADLERRIMENEEYPIPFLDRSRLFRFLRTDPWYVDAAAFERAARAIEDARSDAGADE